MNNVGLRGCSARRAARADGRRAVGRRALGYDTPYGAHRDESATLLLDGEDRRDL